LRSKQTVRDVDFLIKSALAEVKKNDVNSIRAYYSGLLSGFLIAQTFVALKAMTITGEVWRVLNGEIDPVPTLGDFHQRILHGTFGVVDLNIGVFINPELRYNRMYSMGMADAAMVSLLEVPRLLMVIDGEKWQSSTLFWIGLKVADIMSRMEDL